MAQFIQYPFYVKRLARKFLRKQYGCAEARNRWKRTQELYCKFVSEAPDLGGSENNMSSNLYLALAVFALYEAADRQITPDEMYALMTDAIPRKIPVISNLLDMNKPGNQERLRTRFKKYKALSDANLSIGEWGNSWHVELNPHGRKQGVAFDLTSCPLVDFARSHGYMEIMPVLCRCDFLTARLMKARLIRQSTIAEGADRCDYWYVGDKEAVE